MSKYGREVNKYLIQVQKGDKTQLGAVFELTANHLRAIAIKYLTNKSYCDDVVSDAFCKVLQYISSFDPNQDGYNWLCRIVEKVAYTYNEKEKAINTRQVPLEKVWNFGIEEKGKESKLDLLVAMRKLSPENREMIYDYFYLDFSYSELAAKYHLAKSAVYKRVMGSFKKMKKYLQEGEQTDGEYGK